MQKPNKNKKIISVLLIGNYKITRIGLKESLAPFKNIYITDEAENEKQALLQCQNSKPDIILIDDFKDLNTQSLLLKLKTITEKSKIIIITDPKSSKDILSTICTGVNAYCSKDITPETLARVIISVSKGACWIDPDFAEIVLDLFKHSLNHTIIDVHLTSREKEVLKLVVNGESNAEIADKLIVSVHTAKAHVCNVIQKLGVQDRVQAAVLAVKANLV